MGMARQGRKKRLKEGITIPLPISVDRSLYCGCALLPIDLQLKRGANGEVEDTAGLASALIHIVPILETDRANGKINP